jgi:hypothetical protein
MSATSAWRGSPTPTASTASTLVSRPGRGGRALSSTCRGCARSGPRGRRFADEPGSPSGLPCLQPRPHPLASLIAPPTSTPPPPGKDVVEQAGIALKKALRRVAPHIMTWRQYGERPFTQAGGNEGGGQALSRGCPLLGHLNSSSRCVAAAPQARAGALAQSPGLLGSCPPFPPVPPRSRGRRAHAPQAPRQDRGRVPPRLHEDHHRPLRHPRGCGSKRGKGADAGAGRLEAFAPPGPPAARALSLGPQPLERPPEPAPTPPTPPPQHPPPKNRPQAATRCSRACRRA